MSTDFDFTSVTPESLKTEMKASLAAGGVSVDTREGSYTDLLLSTAAYQIYKLYAYFPTLLAAAVPSTASGEFLDSFGAMFGMDRTQGTKATVTVTFSGTDGTAIPQGTVVVSDGGLQYTTDEAVTITGGTAAVTATAAEVGDAYNAQAGSVTRMLVVLPGVTGVTNRAAGAGGSDVETDEAYYGRIHTFLATPVASGNANHYKQWAGEVSGVGHVAVLPLWNGAGTVKVIVSDPDKLPLDDTIVEAVAAHIEKERPIGAEVTVVSVEGLSVDISATCTLEDGATADSVAQALSARLEELFAEMELGAGETIRYNRVLATLLALPGVVDYGEMTVNEDTANLTLTTDQVPILGTVTISEG
jgi:uncharacterized phage protein gp47/JayE